MLPGRLRECLRILRWREADLAELSGHDIAEVAAWLDGRVRAPLAVAAWLEALVKAHLSVPPIRTGAMAAAIADPDGGDVTVPSPTASS